MQVVDTSARLAERRQAFYGVMEILLHFTVIMVVKIPGVKSKS